MKVSTNYSRDEFLEEGRIMTPIQEFMLTNLCNNILEPLRFFLSCKIKIIDGIRFPKDINTLRQEGYHPSETSDHLFGSVIRVRTMKKKAKYGDYYSYSVGAADIAPAIGAKKSWDMMKCFFNLKKNTIELPNQTIKVGQCILEKRTPYIIHISNPPDLIYNNFFTSKFLKKQTFLTCSDNGETYEPLI